MHQFFDLSTIIQTFGYIGIVAIVFSETGLLIGLFLPGDSLLFTAGFLASQNLLNIYILVTVTCIAAIAGDSFSYAFGKRVGPRIFIRENSLFFNKEYIERTKIFYERYGGKTLVIARFMPFVRTLAPIFAGVGRMQYSKFFFYNVFGAILWTFVTSLLGYFLGRIIPNVDHYLLPIVFAIMIVSSLPSIIHVLRNEQYRAQILQVFRKKILRRK